MFPVWLSCPNHYQFVLLFYRYDRQKLSLKEISNCMFVSCMNPTAGSFTIDSRLQRHFCTFAVRSAYYVIETTGYLFSLVHCLIQLFILSLKLCVFLELSKVQFHCFKQQIQCLHDVFSFFFLKMHVINFCLYG